MEREGSETLGRTRRDFIVQAVNSKGDEVAKWEVGQRQDKAGGVWFHGGLPGDAELIRGVFLGQSSYLSNQRRYNETIARWDRGCDIFRNNMLWHNGLSLSRYPQAPELPIRSPGRPDAAIPVTCYLGVVATPTPKPQQALLLFFSSYDLHSSFKIIILLPFFSATIHRSFPSHMSGFERNGGFDHSRTQPRGWRR